MNTVILARTPEHLDDFRTLVREFIAWALEQSGNSNGPLPPVFAKVEEELAHLPGKYAEPDGGISLAYVDDRLAGCLAGFRGDDRSIELTRMWVRPDFRGQRIGDELVQHLLSAARNAGYTRAVLRSHKDLLAAHKVYRNAGFADMDGNAQFPGFGKIEIAMQRPL